ncbi:MAG: ribose-phosphate pyrophosphokinase [Flavobacteriales bacterium]|nr:ribose-phosphate pyrophosphokinase [Flavobacteriales bacterium]
MSSQPKFFACRSSADLAERIARAFGTELGKLHVLEFSDGEFQPYYEESVRGCDVFIIQSTFPPADNLMELLLAVDAARRASARNIIAVMPYFGFARQDRKDRPRVSIGSKLVANLLTAAGVTRIITMDLHADQIQGFFDVPVDHLYASAIFAPYIRNLGLDNMVVAAPDIGGSKRANSYSKFLGLEMAMVYKQRAKANQVQAMTMIGDVQGKHVIMIDDMVDTAGTLTKAADLMMENGALSVRAFCTHPILSGNAYERIEQSKLTEMLVTDTIPLKKKSDKIRVLSVADLFSDVIKKLLEDESISSTFIF